MAQPRQDRSWETHLVGAALLLDKKPQSALEWFAMGCKDPSVNFNASFTVGAGRIYFASATFAGDTGALLATAVADHDTYLDFLHRLGVGKVSSLLVCVRMQISSCPLV
jgi:hypothetical protein